MKIYNILFLLATVLISCKQNLNDLKHAEIPEFKKEDVHWFHLDLEKDSIPGISLERAYQEFKLEGKGEEIIVAVLDKPISIFHEDLIDQIHNNTSEIPNNNQDDDKNGYVDDIHGWNFLGYGEFNFERFSSYHHVRTIKAYDKKFKGKNKSDIDSIDIPSFEKYSKAIAKHKILADKQEKYLGYVLDGETEYFEFIKTFTNRFNGKLDFNEDFLDSIVPSNEKEKKLIQIQKRNLDWGYDFDFTYSDRGNNIIQFFRTNSLHYNERKNIGDELADYEDVTYGNNAVNATSDITHGTQVSGLIAATRNNAKGIRGFSNNIKIMPIVISPQYGDYNDKDLANGVRYAVDNGARIINFSGVDYDCQNEAYLFAALKHAENNGVIVVSAAGNDSKNTDLVINKAYFNHRFKNDSLTNLIRVGATTEYLGKELFGNYSNYGKHSTDLFAPGTDMITTDSSILRYASNYGSSFSTALTSGAAALIWSNYPNLSSKQVKSIILNSGTEYNNLYIPISENDSTLFRDLSKSGKVLNVYNAMKMAKDQSR